MDYKDMVNLDCFIDGEPCAYIIDDAKCGENCSGKGCIYLCPAGLFREIDDKVVLDRDGTCLECGACRLVCNNISFEYPEGGKGISNRFG